MDTLGYVYFKDRLVDTFQFKGYTIFPAEIESCLSQVCDLVDCVVYGVSIPGSPERAVMATILDPDGELAIVGLPERLLQRLCEHELPVFIRAAHFIEQTGELPSIFGTEKAGKLCLAVCRDFQTEED